MTFPRSDMDIMLVEDEWFQWMVPKDFPHLSTYLIGDYLKLSRIQEYFTYKIEASFKVGGNRAVSWWAIYEKWQQKNLKTKRNKKKLKNHPK